MAEPPCILRTLLCIFFSVLGVVELSEIVSFKRPTSQRSNYILPIENRIVHTSENGVDGNKRQTFSGNSCTHQAFEQKEAWWRVDLQRQVTVEKVQIYYRDEGSVWAGWRNRFAGYEIYLSNTTERNREDRCFQDKSENVNQIQSIVTHEECNGTAQYVTIYNTRNQPKRQDWYSSFAFLELCEVEVYGCESGKYGNRNCDHNCSPNCPGGVCHPSSGNCLYCDDNTFTYHWEENCLPCPERCAGQCDRAGGCNECQDGFFGLECSYRCPANCGSRKCEKTFGDCFDCQVGFHGYRCMFPCPSSCLTRECNKTSGNCLECPEGFYGQGCGKQCPASCGSGGCKLSDGTCKDQEPEATSSITCSDQNETERKTNGSVTIPVLSSVVGLLAVLLTVSTIYIKLRMKLTPTRENDNTQDNNYTAINTMELQSPNVYEELAGPNNDI